MGGAAEGKLVIIAGYKFDVVVWCMCTLHVHKLFITALALMPLAVLTLCA